MFCGEAGSAKSVIIGNYLAAMNPETHSKLISNFSSRTLS
jgi:hypothetical protein